MGVGVEKKGEQRYLKKRIKGKQGLDVLDLEIVPRSCWSCCRTESLSRSEIEKKRIGGPSNRYSVDIEKHQNVHSSSLSCWEFFARHRDGGS